MEEVSRSPREMAAELAALRRRVAVLERERQLAARLLHGDPEHRLAPLLSQVPAILWVTDASLRLTWWTGGGIESLEGAASDWVGVDIYAFLGTDDPRNPAIAAHRAALAGEPSTYELEREGVFFTAHVGPHYDPDGTITGVVGVSIDISARVRAERKLRRAMDRVRTLSGLIPICMHCKNVRNDSGFWDQVENYVREHSMAEFTHAICPDCMKRALEPEPKAG